MQRIVLAILLILSLGANGQVIVASSPYKLISNTPTISGVEIRIDMRGAGTSSATGYNYLTGSPHSSVLSIANLNDTLGASTGVSISTISTSNWSAYSGCSCSVNDAVTGITGGSYLGNGANAAVYQSIFFTYGTVAPARYSADFPQFRLSGLDPSSTYTIKLCGGDGSLGFTAKWSTRALGATLTSEVEVDGDVTNITTGATLVLQPSVAGVIDIYFNSSTTNSGDLAPISGIVITK